ncbi:MAG: hypothetical protein ACRD0Q_05745 [Acidimicrobiales bacterium]
MFVTVCTYAGQPKGYSAFGAPAATAMPATIAIRWSFRNGHAKRPRGSGGSPPG